MALPIGKLTILVGAGIVGSVLAKEGQISGVSDIFSGALKLVFKGIRQDQSGAVVKKPRNDSLMAQVHSLRQELQILQNRPVTIVTTAERGASRYGIVIVLVTVGYGYVWWKGWKLPDLMFATRRSLSDACNTIAKQLENVYTSIAATKRHLSSRMDRLDANVDEFAQITSATREMVSDISSDFETINVNVASVRYAVENLETKIGRIESKQDATNIGVLKLCDFASTLETRTVEHIQASPASSSKPALEPPPVSPSQRAASLPPVGLSVVYPSQANSNGSLQQKNATLETMDLASTDVPSNIQTPENGSSNRSSVSGLFSKRLSTTASFLTRTHTATNAVLQQMRSGRQPF